MPHWVETEGRLKMKLLCYLSIVAALASGCDRPEADIRPPPLHSTCPAPPGISVLLGTDWSDQDKDAWITERRASHRLCIARL